MLLPPGMTHRDVFNLRDADPERFANLDPKTHREQLRAWHLELHPNAGLTREPPPSQSRGKDITKTPEYLRTKELILRLLQEQVDAQNNSATSDSSTKPEPPVSLSAFRNRRASASSTPPRTKG